MAEVVAEGNENFENLLKRFNRKVQQSVILSEIRHREFYEKPSVKRKRKEAAGRRRRSKAIRR